MSAHLSRLRLRLFQRHLRGLGWVWVWVCDWIHSHTPPRTRSPFSRPHPFTHWSFPPQSLVCGGQPSPHKSLLVVSHSTCPPLSSSPHAHSFVLGTAVIKAINNNNLIGTAVINTHLTHLPRPGWAPDPLMVGIRSPDGLVVGFAPATLEFWVRFPERNLGKQGATLC
jgi:hypothetical protein